jgi:hypothetical protein
MISSPAVVPKRTPSSKRKTENPVRAVRRTAAEKGPPNCPPPGYVRGRPGLLAPKATRTSPAAPREPQPRRRRSGGDGPLSPDFPRGRRQPPELQRFAREAGEHRHAVMPAFATGHGKTAKRYSQPFGQPAGWVHAEAPLAAAPAFASASAHQPGMPPIMSMAIWRRFSRRSGASGVGLSSYGSRMHTTTRVGMNLSSWVRLLPSHSPRRKSVSASPASRRP